MRFLLDSYEATRRNYTDNLHTTLQDLLSPRPCQVHLKCHLQLHYLYDLIHPLVTLHLDHSQCILFLLHLVVIFISSSSKQLRLQLAFLLLDHQLSRSLILHLLHLELFKRLPVLLIQLQDRLLCLLLISNLFINFNLESQWHYSLITTQEITPCTFYSCNFTVLNLQALVDQTTKLRMAEASVSRESLQALNDVAKNTAALFTDDADIEQISSIHGALESQAASRSNQVNSQRDLLKSLSLLTHATRV